MHLPEVSNDRSPSPWRALSGREVPRLREQDVARRVVSPSPLGEEAGDLIKPDMNNTPKRKEAPMKIAVATEDGKTISEHFGRSPYFAVFEVENGAITNQSMRRNTFTRHFRGEHERHTQGEHHHSGEDAHAHDSLAEGLGDCRAVISHGMGRRAWEDLRARGIEMIVTDETEVQRAVDLYLAGNLRNNVERLD
jgi:predicted Fe-Mo cluster-binding NifX family protein